VAGGWWNLRVTNQLCVCSPTYRATKTRTFTRIAITEGVRSGKPRIAGTRITVGAIMGFIVAYSGSFEEVIYYFPYLTKEDIVEALEYVQAKEHREAFVLKSKETDRE